MNLDNLAAVLADLARDMRDNYKDRLQFSGRYTKERTLIDSVKTQVVVNDKAFEVTMTLADYWKYVEDDTRPHWPPRNAIARWIEIKPIIPRPDANGIRPTNQQLAFLISRKIAREGTKGSHDLQITKDNVIPWYRQRIAEALGHDMVNYIRKVIRE